jgi:DNA repair protein RecN (Recombination protein N)
MLKKIYIKNFALIENLEFKPSSHFNIITGETGAGKSIILGALGLLTGGRADNKAIVNEDEKCIIEGTFEIENESVKVIFEENELDFDLNVIIRREISPQGKSRAFINDTPVSLETLKSISSFLIDIHSQHDNLLLGSADFQLNVIDLFAELKPKLDIYKRKFDEYKKLKKYFEELTQLSLQSQKEMGFEQYLLNELKEARLVEGEQEKIESNLQILENAEEILLKIAQINQILDENEFSVISGLNSAANIFNQISKLSSNFNNYKNSIQSCLVEIKDIAKEIHRESEKISIDPVQLEESRTRLDLIYKLEKKHQVSTIADLLVLKNSFENKVNSYQSIDGKLAEYQLILPQLEKELESLAKEISKDRKNVFEPLIESLTAMLIDLGMPNATLKIQHDIVAFHENGIDKLNFLFSANKGMEPQSLKVAASGGEFSRLMFVLKNLMAEKMRLPTMIFDEIDTGISGEIAIKMGEMMKKMAKNHQIIVITHLHQIAAKGDAHYYVYKQHGETKSRTQLKELDKFERIKEIAQMIGGSNPSVLAFQSAKELIDA